MEAKELIRELPKGIIKWYRFNKGSSAMYVSCGIESDGALLEALLEAGISVDTVANTEIDQTATYGANYDYVIISGALERSKDPTGLLTAARSLLNENGRLILIADNRLGIRYFCGDRDKFTDCNFDGIENYARINSKDKARLDGRAYSKAEIIDMLEKAGFAKHHFYSVFPSVSNPQLLFSEDYIPKEQLDSRIFPQYNSPETVFLNENLLYSSLIPNGLLHPMANGFFVECPLEGDFDKALQVTISMERGRENALCTIIRNDNKAVKRAVYAQGREKADKLLDNNNYLKNHGVHMVEAVVEDDEFVMPFIDAETATDHFRQTLAIDRESFYGELDRFRAILSGSSEHVPYEEVDWDRFDPYWERRKDDDPNRYKWRDIAFGSDGEKENLGIILKRGYIDLVSLNCFYIDGEYVFYDQEMYIENLPLNAIFHRTVNIIYGNCPMMERLLPRKELLEHYHLDEYETLWNQYNSAYLDKLRNDRILASYYSSIRRDFEAINANRHRMNYSTDEYERLFRDVFKDLERRQVYIFGSGKFAGMFMKEFARIYDISGMVDNNSDKWGGEFEGVTIYPPEHLKKLDSGTYKVIICIKNYFPIVSQLRDLGVRNYSVYDPTMIYERKLANDNIVAVQNDSNAAPKKYHVGYIAGVFDLFHIGHLNMFRRAKEQCDYLIVGVVNDELVVDNKKTLPYVHFDERIEIVRSCKYVDEAVELTKNNADTYEMYHRYKFDVQFSGSDYENDPGWLAKQVYLRKHGSDLVFFPYTQSTSSSKLKAMIEKKLL